MPYTEAAHLLHPLRGLILSPKRLVKYLGLRPDFTVLELGPGPGYFSVEVARSLPQGRLILVDVQPEMLEMARERLSSTGFTNVEYFAGDAVSLPLESDSVDVAFLVAVLGEVPEPLAALHEVMRVLRPGGLLSLTEHSIGDPHSLSQSELVRMAEGAGFQLTGSHGRWLSQTVDFRA
jgi:ubiquinone/menaquinone biosynthesis C-methylase UbiE